MRIFRVPKTLHNSMARPKRFRCGSNGSLILILPIGEPMALSLKPFLSSSALNSLIWRSFKSRTLVLRIERNSMCLTPHCLSTSICFSGLGSISSANAEMVNITAILTVLDAVDLLREMLTSSFGGDNGQLRFVGDEGLLAVGGEANADLAQGPVAAHFGHFADAVAVV